MLPACPRAQSFQGLLTLTACLDTEREVEESKEDDVGFIEAREDAAETFESAEEPLDKDFENGRLSTALSLLAVGQ